MTFFSNRFHSPICQSPRFWVLGIVAVALLPISGCRSKDPEAMKAVETADRMMQGLENDQFQVVWDCWTNSQREEINQLVHRFAKKAPPRLWNNAFEVAELWGQVLKEKREFALKCPHLKKGHANLKEYGTDLSGFLTTVAKSDARDLQKLGKADVGELLKQFDPQFMQAIPALLHLMSHEADQQMALAGYQNALDAFSEASVSLEDSGEGWAEVRFSTSDTDASIVRFNKVDGRWIPRLSARGEWETALMQASQWVDNFNPAKMPELEMANLGLVTLAIPHLQQALKAETQAEFDALFQNGPNPILPFFFFAGEKKFPIPQ